MSDARRSTAARARRADPRASLRGKRFLAADRAALDLAEIGTWDQLPAARAPPARADRRAGAVRADGQHRDDGAAADAARRPGRRRRGQSAEDGMPDPFADGTPRAGRRAPALGDARRAAARHASSSAPTAPPTGCALPLLPDRWVVLRIVLAARRHATPVVTGWVLEADRAVAVPLAQWSEGGARLADRRRRRAWRSTRDELTGTVGGVGQLVGASTTRCSTASPSTTRSTDSATLAPGGVDEDCAAYVVAGWWSDPALDPLDTARSNDSLHELLDRLRWRLLYEWGDEHGHSSRSKAQFELRKALGLTTADRWSQPAAGRQSAAVRDAARAAAGTTPFVPIDTTFITKQPSVSRRRPSRAMRSSGSSRRPGSCARRCCTARSTACRCAASRCVDRRPDGRPRSARGARPARRRPPRRASPPPQATIEQAPGHRAAARRVHVAEGQPPRLGRRRWWSSRSTSTRRPSPRCRRAPPAPTAILQRVQTGGAGGLGLGKKRGERVGSRHPDGHVQGRRSRSPARGPGGARARCSSH